MMTCVYSVQRARLDLHLEQLRRAADAAERVLDLVREVADQLLGDLGLVERALLAVLARLLLDLDQLDHDVGRAVHLVDDDVHRQRLAVARARPPQQGLEPAGGEVVAADRDDGVAQPLRVDEPVEHRAARHAPARQAEHVLERGVGEHAFAFAA